VGTSSLVRYIVTSRSYLPRLTSLCVTSYTRVTQLLGTVHSSIVKHDFMLSTYEQVLASAWKKFMVRFTKLVGTSSLVRYIVTSRSYLPWLTSLCVTSYIRVTQLLGTVLGSIVKHDFMLSTFEQVLASAWKKFMVRFTQLVGTSSLVRYIATSRSYLPWLTSLCVTSYTRVTQLLGLLSYYYTNGIIP